MKVELDETTSDGIQFLLIGVGSLLVLRLLFAGVLMLMGVPDGDELAIAIAQFRNGYWISDTDVLVTSAGSIGTRLALAVCVPFIVAFLAAGIVYQLATLAGKESIGSWLFALRTTLAVVLAWSLFAALLLPPSSVTFNDAGFTTTERPALFGVLSLPWTSTTTTHPWSTVRSITVEDTEEGSTVTAIQYDGTRVRLAHGAKDDAVLPELARLIKVRYLRN